jgi:hypothetical protein
MGTGVPLLANLDIDSDAARDVVIKLAAAFEVYSCAG